MEPADPKTQEHYRRWCRRADLDALAALFDAVAPGLLRVAHHLTPDPAEAEDLVQAAFLAAIERREALDPEQDGVGWLVAVVRRRAVDGLRRRGERRDAAPLDLDGLTMDGDAVDAPLERKELRAELVRAIDGLEEPYRQPLLLRLRHGATAAEIAHLLDRSPGAVRVQLHRGLARLRRILPASLAGLAAAQLMPPARGLGAVRRAVLARGAAVTTSASGGLTLALVATMTKKTTLVAAAAAALLAAFLFRGLGTHREPTSADPATPERSALPSPSPRSAAELAEVQGPSREQAAPPPPTGDALPFTGLVVDAATGAPVAGARVELFLPDRCTVREALERYPAHFHLNAHGLLTPSVSSRHEITETGLITATIPPTWPAVEVDGEDARVNAGRIEVFAESPARTAPLARTASDANGRFTTTTGPQGESSRLLASVHADGFAVRQVCVQSGTPVLVELHRPIVIRGTVVGTDGEPVSLALALCAERTDPEVEDERWMGHSIPRGLWMSEIHSDETGHFEADSVALDVFARSLDPCWRVLSTGPTAAGGLLVSVERDHCIRFIDASSGEPLEQVGLVARTRDRDPIGLSGQFMTPDGMLDRHEASHFDHWVKQGGLWITAWTDRHVPQEIEVPERPGPEPIVVALERGVPPGVAGGVRRGGSAVQGALVELVAVRRIAWRPDEEDVLARTRTDAAGRFRLHGPAGLAVLRVDTGAGPHVTPVELPVAAPLDIDLDGLAGLRVRVVAPGDRAQRDHVVAVHGPRGFQEVGFTDDEGQVQFSGLPHGEFLVGTPLTTTRGSFGLDVREEVHLEEGRTVSVTLEIADPDLPRHLRVDGAVPLYSGWRARTEKDPWVALEPDGLVPVDLAQGAWRMRVQADDGRTWEFSIPRGAPDGHVVPLIEGDAVLRGVVRGPDGAPLAGLGLKVRSTSPGRARDIETAATTDARGAFELRDLARTPVRIALRTRPGQLGGDDDTRIGRTSFRWTEPLGDETWVELRVPADGGTMTVAGKLEVAHTGHPPSDYVLMIEAATSDGPLRTLPAEGRSFTNLDVDGRFSAEVERSPSFEVSVWLRGEADVLLRRTIEVPAGAEPEPLVLRVP